jgi:hypothetical protein
VACDQGTNTCTTCGGMSQPCCANNMCNTGFTCHGGTCR